MSLPPNLTILESPEQNDQRDMNSYTAHAPPTMSLTSTSSPPLPASSTSASSAPPTAAMSLTSSAAAVASSAPVDMNRLVVFCANKAGMENAVVSKEHINAVIYEASRNSLHFAHQERMASKVGERIARAKMELANEEKAQRRMPALAQAAQLVLSKRLADLESSRCLHRIHIHIDMDMFYAAVEVRDRPEIADKPVAVGGMGMISTSNYVARKFGVRSAMPGFIALKLCPNLIFIKPNFTKYEAVAAQTRAIFADYDAQYESASLDEAYLDVTEYVWRIRHSLNIHSLSHCPCQRIVDSSASSQQQPAQAHADLPILYEEAQNIPPFPPTPSFTSGELSLHSHLAACIAAQIRQRIFQVTQLTCSAGIACNRLLAKMCTDVQKPNGQFALSPDQSSILSFLAPQSVRKLPGIGKVMERMLNELGIQTCADMRREDNIIMLFKLFSELTATWLLSLSLGLGATTHSPDQSRRSISTERTFSALCKYADIKRKLEELADSLAKDVEREGCVGKCLTLKLKDVDFTCITRALTLSGYISSSIELRKYGMQILIQECEKRKAKVAQPFAGLQSNTTTPPSSTPSSSHLYDDLLHLRLMGLRLSTLKESKEEHKEGMQKGIERFVQHGESNSATSATPSSPPHTSSTSSSSSPSITSFFMRANDIPDATSQMNVSKSETTKKEQTVKPGTLDKFLHHRSSVHLRTSPPQDSSDDDCILIESEQEEVEQEEEDWFEKWLTQEPSSEQSANGTLTSSLESFLPPSKPPRKAIMDTSSASMTAAKHENEDASESGDQVMGSSAAASSFIAPPSTTSPPPLSSSSAAATIITCPICEMTFSSAVGNVVINHHIDECLQQHNQRPASNKSKKRAPVKSDPALRTLEQLCKKPRSNVKQAIEIE